MPCTARRADPTVADVHRGLGTEDDPAFAGMHEASARIAQGTLDICRGVWQGDMEHGVNYCGGLHHAMRGYASGFCIYNDVGVGIQWLLDHGAERVAYVDIDVHHGDGVERMFWNDPRVLTISVHESGRHLFPGTGWPADIGGPSARGTVANVALPPGTGDSAWLRSIDVGRAAAGAGLRPRRAGHPARLRHPHARPAGPPRHHRRRPAPRPRDAARPGARDGIRAVGGARWRRLRARRGGAPLVDPPHGHRRPRADAGRHRRARSTGSTTCSTRWGAPRPSRMGDLPASALPIWVQPWNMGHNPENPVDRAVLATRQAVFPLHGLDPWFD